MNSCYTGKLWKVVDYGYVGPHGHKYYGSTTEISMMQEIYKNGPIAAAFHANFDLYYYQNGIFVGNNGKQFKI